MSTKILSPDESKKWSDKLKKSTSASPLVFARGDEAFQPFLLEVTKGQSSTGGKTLIIHVIKRADIEPERAEEIVRHALVDVFGKHAGVEAECDYRNVAELKKRFGPENVVNEPFDSMTIIFDRNPHTGGVSTIAYTRSIAWVRDKMTVALAKWYEKSRSW